jgi:WD40 repeat protein
LLGDQNTSLTRLTFEPTVSILPELRIEPSQSGQSLHTIQGTEGLFCAKPVQESKDGPAHWSLMRFDPREDQFVTVGELPKEHQLVHLIGCPNLNQWLIRCTRTSDTAPIGKQETFLGLWDTQKNAFIWTTDFDSSSFRHAEMSPNGRLMVYEQATKIFLVDSNTGAHRQIAHQPDLSVSHLKFSPDSKLLAVALNENGTIGGYRVADLGKKIWEIRMHGGPIRDLCWSKDQQILLSLGGDGRLRTYDLNSLRISSEIALPISDPKHLRLGAYEQSVLVLDNQGSILRIPCSDSTAIGAE